MGPAERRDMHKQVQRRIEARELAFPDCVAELLGVPVDDDRRERLSPAIWKCWAPGVRSRISPWRPLRSALFSAWCASPLFRPRPARRCMSTSSSHSIMNSVRSTRPISRSATARSCWRGQDASFRRISLGRQSRAHGTAVRHDRAFAHRPGPFCFRVREPDVTAGGRGRGGRSHRGNGFDGRPWRCRGLRGGFRGFGHASAPAPSGGAFSRRPVRSGQVAGGTMARRGPPGRGRAGAGRPRACGRSGRRIARRRWRRRSGRRGCAAGCGRAPGSGPRHR